MTAPIPRKHGTIRRAAVFLNEAAGAGRSARTRQTVDLVRRALDAELLVTATRDAEELRAWMAARVEGYDTVVVAGGDGSLSVAYNVVEGRDLTLGYIPAGFGNATAHLLRLPRDPHSLAAVIGAGFAQEIDLVAVDGHLCLFAGAGWDALVARRYALAGARRLPGWARAIAESVPDLFRRPHVRVVADARAVHDGPMELLVVSTTPFYGRGLRINPGARCDRGRASLRVYPGPAPRLALDAIRWAAGARPSVPRTDARVVAISSVQPLVVQADGDVLGERRDWRLEVRPAAVRLIGRWAAPA